MRIALVVTGGVDESGRERIIPALLSLIERLARRHAVHVYALRHLAEPRTYALVGALVHDLGRPEGIRAQFRRLSAALSRDGPFDVVHGYWALPAGLVAAMAGRRFRIPSIVTFDSGEFISLPEIGYGNQLTFRHRRAVAATLSLATRSTVCSHYQERLALAHGASPQVVPIGVDRRLFHPPADRRSSGPPWRLLHVASLNLVKDQPTLIEALRQLADRGAAVHLDIVGEDTLDGSTQALARRAGVDHLVTFHGFLPTDVLVPLYQRAHLLVVSSRHEAANVAVMEAAACGVPAAGTRVGHVADWAPDRAVAVPPGNGSALAEAIADLLADGDLRDRIAAAARAWTLAHDADWTADTFESIYQEAGLRSL